MANQELPRYDDLPVRADAPPGSSWGLWGDHDVFGALNLLTAERVVRAARLVRKGAVFALNLDAELPDPPLFGRKAPTHTVTGGGGLSQDDELDFNTQSSSQWDGFRHIRAPQGFYGGVDNEEHGIHHWARRGLAGRGVLADVGRWRAARGRPIDFSASDPIEPDDVTGTLETEGVQVEPGDILLVRTGWVAWYRQLDEAGRQQLAADLKAPGLRPGDGTARLLWDLHVAAVAADNPSLECWPPGSATPPEAMAAARADDNRRHEIFVHLSLLPRLGIPIGELWDLEALAADCEADGVYDFLLTSAPLNIAGGVASPPNALAIK